MNDLPRRIRHWRTQAGLNVSQLAHLCGVTVGAVSHWEAGRSTPSICSLYRIVVACGVTMRVFFGDIPDEPVAEAA